MADAPVPSEPEAEAPAATPGIRRKRLGWLQALDCRLPDGAVVWDLEGGAGPAAALLSKRHSYRGVVPEPAALAQARRRVPRGTFVEGTWETVEIEEGTADAVIVPTARKGAPPADARELVGRAASWLKPGGYLLVNARPREVPAYAPSSWLLAASETEPRRSIPTAGAFHESGLVICDYELSPAKKGTQRTLWLIAALATGDVDVDPQTTSPAAPPDDLDRRREQLTVFIHIPKAAGTTFTDVLRNNYRPGTVGRLGNLFKGSGGHDPAVLQRIEDARERTVWMHALTGHLPLGIRDFLPADTRYVTFLREPLDRLLSHYTVLVSLKRGPNATLPQLDPDTPLQDVLADGRYIFDNLQTRMLCGDHEPFGEVTREMLDRAKENLRSESLVFGLTKRYDESLVLIGRRLGLHDLVCRSRRVNSNRVRSTPSEIPDYAREFDRYDSELYAYARDLFDRLVAEEDEDFAREVQALGEARAALGEPGREGRRKRRQEERAGRAK